MDGEGNDGNRSRRGEDETSRQGGSARARPSGLRRLIFWTLLLVGVLLLLLVVAGVVIVVLVVTNADAALGWVGGLLDQLTPIVSVLRQLTGS